MTVTTDDAARIRVARVAAGRIVYQVERFPAVPAARAVRLPWGSRSSGQGGGYAVTTTTVRYGHECGTAGQRPAGHLMYPDTAEGYEAARGEVRLLQSVSDVQHARALALAAMAPLA